MTGLRAALAGLLAVLPGMVSAGPGVPGPDYFKGLYVRVGRDAATPPALIDDLVRLEPRGTGLTLKSCAAADIALTFDPWSEIENLIVGPPATRGLWCLFHNNGQNYPLLTCADEAGTMFTLWPLEDRFDEALDCAGG